MRLHILGICGTFMGGLALLGRELGFDVSGSDSNVYPPMSTQLAGQGIDLIDGFDPEQLEPAPDLVLVGNALSRGNPCVEYLLNSHIHFTSGAQWLGETILRDRHVLAVSGTHGKTTTASMLAWILEVAGLDPGFMIGGISENFGCSARCGGNDYFVVEADEYDTAFFDKRSKFVHYSPNTLIINNIEFDHADIFSDIAAIRRQFHHLMRIVPDHGLVIARQADPEIKKVFEMGCWTPVEYIGEEGARWIARPLSEDFSEFEVLVDDTPGGILRWDLFGKHNAMNALAAIAAANHIGITTGEVCEALAGFKSVKRRMEKLGEINGICVYDDFAHHPTEIALTLHGLRQRVGNQRIIAVMEPRSNTMRQGIHRDELSGAFADADQVVFYQAPELDWDLGEATREIEQKRRVLTDIDSIVDTVCRLSQNGDHVIIMSNGSFGGLPGKLTDRLGQC